MAGRACDDCKRYLYDVHGDVVTKRIPLPIIGAGPPGFQTQKQEAPPGYKPPCWTCPKQPDDVPRDDRRPESARELQPRHLRAVQHYFECKATGDWPRGADGRVDPIVRWSASVISGVVESVREGNVAGRLERLAQLATIGVQVLQRLG